MKCEQAQPNLLDYSRGLLDHKEAEAIRIHLDACADCRALLKAEAQLADRLSALPQAELRSDVWPLVQTKMRTAPRPVALLDVIRKTYIRRLAAALAVVAVAAALTLFALVPQQSAQTEGEAIKQAAALMRVPDQQADPVGTTEAMIDVLQREL